MSHEPLQSSHFATILCNNIIGHPTLRSSFESGNLDKSKKLRYSVKYNLLLSTPIFSHGNICAEKCLNNSRKNVNNVIIDVINNIIPSG